jgi:hypothetical protein
MSQSGTRISLFLFLTIGVALATAVQAIAVAQAASLLPDSWAWAHNPTVAWLVVAGMTLLTIGLARALANAQAAERRSRDRRHLIVEPEPSFQTTIGIHRPPSVAIRWTPLFKLSYTGSRVLTVLDIIPMPPLRQANESRTVQLVRSKTSSRYKAHSSYSALAQAHREGPDEEFNRVEKWPLLLQPGARVNITVEQEYEFRINGRARSFDSDDDMLAMLGPYFDLKPTKDGGFWAGSKLLPTRVVCTDDEWDLEAAYAIFPVGVSLRLPTESVEEILARDELS